jgi:hypothetical protein
MLKKQEHSGGEFQVPKARRRRSSSQCSGGGEGRSVSRSRDAGYYFHMASPQLADWPEIEVEIVE